MNANYTGKLISERRKALGMTQKQLAELLHVTDKAVSKWERGINFPDLYLMENLAAALDTTPAALLGLENANQDEIVSNIARISEENLDTARKHLHIAGWAAIGLSILLWMGFLQDDMYALLGRLLPLMVLGGLYLLFRFGAIKPWDGPDILIFYGSLLPLGICLSGYWMTDYGFSDWVNIPCILISAAGLQWLCYRIMRSTWAKALPVMGLAAFLLWHLSGGRLDLTVLGCLGVCTAIWLLLRGLDKQRKPIPVGKLAAVFALGMLLFGFLFYDALVKAYVHLRQDHLIAYCEELLDSGEESATYGLWDVFVYPEEGMVEFYTGGSGIGSQTSYEGFYYSADDTHIPFQGADLPMDIHEPTATGYWTDGTDNHGSSQRLWKYFYWFEAYF